MNKRNKQSDLKRQQDFTLFDFICGGPCHRSSSSQYSRGPYFPPENILFTHLWKQMNMSDLTDNVNIYIQFEYPLQNYIMPL